MKKVVYIILVVLVCIVALGSIVVITKNDTSGQGNSSNSSYDTSIPNDGDEDLDDGGSLVDIALNRYTLVF